MTRDDAKVASLRIRGLANLDFDGRRLSEQFLEGFDLIGSLPVEIRIFSAEMAIGCGFLIDGAEQVEVADDRSWLEGEDFSHQLG